MNASIVNTIVSGALAVTCLIAGSILSAYDVGAGDILIGGGLGIVGKYAVDRRVG